MPTVPIGEYPAARDRCPRWWSLRENIRGRGVPPKRDALSAARRRGLRYVEVALDLLRRGLLERLEVFHHAVDARVERHPFVHLLVQIIQDRFHLPADVHVAEGVDELLEFS